MVRFRNPFANNKGFSLMELVVAAAISIIVGGVGTFILVLAVETYTRMVRQYEAESEMAGAMLAVSATLSNSQKMSLRGNLGSINTVTNRAARDAYNNPNASFVTRGYLAANFAPAMGGDTNLVAMGITESGNRVNRSNLTAFGIFFQRPTDNRSGALYIDKERQSNSWVKVSPMNARQSFGRFVHFGVTEVRTRGNSGQIVISNTAAAATANSNRSILSANFVFQMRYFTRGKKQNFFWCPSSINSTFCTTNMNEVQYYDMTKNLNVVFANQEMTDYPLTNSTYMADRMFGKIYFFKFLPSFK